MRNLRSTVVLLLTLSTSLFAASLPIEPRDDGATLRFVPAAGRVADARITIAFELAADAVAGALVLRDTGTNDEWSMDVTGDQLERVTSLAVAPGAYRLTLRLPGHRATDFEFRAVSGETTNIGLVTLRPVSVIRGRVVQHADQKAIRGARIACESGSSVTDEVGRFSVEVAGEWPSELQISANGYGSETVALPRAASTVSLPDIELASAASMQLRIVRGTYRGPLEVSAGARNTDEPPRWLFHRRLGANESEAQFTDLPEGIVLAQVRGAAPLQRMGAQSRVVAGATARVELALEPVELHGRVTVAGKPLVHGSVDLGRKDELWDATVTTGDDGTFVEPLWQQGDFRVQVRGGGLRAVIPGEATLRGAESVQWAFDVADRMLRGRVTDAGGQPVMNAIVWLQEASGHAVLRTKTASDGSYEFRGIATGRHSVGVNAPSYLMIDEVPVQIAERADERRDFTLQRGVGRHIEVITAQGSAAQRAIVVCATGAAVRASAITDASGHADLAMPADEAAVIYVFPTEGSLAVRRIEPAAAAAVKIIVPPGTSSLRLATLTTTDEPVANMSLLMRYDGEIVPPDVIQFAKRTGVTLRSDDEGVIALRNIPAGMYEFWPYRTPDEARALIAAATPAAAPVSVAVKSGEHRMTLRFKR